jgi:hypothetical protein
MTHSRIRSKIKRRICEELISKPAGQNVRLVPKQFCVLSCPNLADHRKMKECSVLPAKL